MQEANKYNPLRFLWRDKHFQEHVQLAMHTSLGLLFFSQISIKHFIVFCRIALRVRTLWGFQDIKILLWMQSFWETECFIVVLIKRV